MSVYAIKKIPIKIAIIAILSNFCAFTLHFFGETDTFLIKKLKVNKIN